MRVGVDYTAAINQSAGIGRFVRCLFDAVTTLDRENEYVLLHAAPEPGRSAALPIAPNVSGRELRFRERIMNVMWHRMKISFPVDLLTGPLDIFHSPDFVLPPVRQATTILTVHDLAFLLFPECADQRLRAYLEQVVPRSVARANYIIADSENTKNDLVCLLDANPDRVSVIPGGVDPHFQPAPQEAIEDVQRAYGLVHPYVLGVGVIEPRKNFPRLIEAFTRFRRNMDEPYQLVIAGGKGWLSDETYREAERSAYATDIRFPGYVPDARLPALYTGARAFAYPSLYEGFGLPVLEAMACGTPVVCANTSSLPEFAGDAALLVPPEDPGAIASALERVCREDGLGNQLRRRGCERARDYTWERSAELLIALYNRVYAETH
jgi:glycosyltransferase involved in cell wall biosynthesis